MRTRERVERPSVAEAAPATLKLGLGKAVAKAAGLFFLLALVSIPFGTATVWDYIGGTLTALVIMAVTVPLLRRQSQIDGDPKLFKLLVWALILKLVGSLARYYVALDVYGGKADAIAYNRAGVELYQSFRSGHFALGGRHFSDTQFIQILTGIVYMFIGPSRSGGFFFFSWLGFIGLLLCYRAFTIAVPEGRNKTYAKMLFFLPTMLFWPSSIGKESWMLFAIGIAAYGVARALSGAMVRGLVVTGLGLWWCGIVRPHIAGILGVSFAVAVIVRPVSARFRGIAPIAKMVSLGLVAVAAAFLIARTNQFLQQSSIDTSQGISGVLGQVSQRSATGHSQYSAPVFRSPSRAPAAIMTVLFRPTILDAHNLQTLAAALEGTFLLGYTLVRLRWLGAALKRFRRRAYVTFAGVEVFISIVALSSLSNFGILARERTQLIPFYLMLFAIPPVAKPVRRRISSQHVAA